MYRLPLLAIGVVLILVSLYKYHYANTSTIESPDVNHDEDSTPDDRRRGAEALILAAVGLLFIIGSFLISKIEKGVKGHSKNTQRIGTMNREDLPFHDLPDPYISMILNNLRDPEDLIRFSQTSKRMRKLAQDRNARGPILIYPDFVADAGSGMLEEPTANYRDRVDEAVRLIKSSDEGLSRVFDSPLESRLFTTMFFPDMYDLKTEEDLKEWNDPDYDFYPEGYDNEVSSRDFINAYSKWTWYRMSSEERKAARTNPMRYLLALRRTLLEASEYLGDDGLDYL
jgi:hypothetical protein